MYKLCINQAVERTCEEGHAHKRVFSQVLVLLVENPHGDPPPPSDPGVCGPPSLSRYRGNNVQGVQP